MQSNVPRSLGAQKVCDAVLRVPNLEVGPASSRQLECPSKARKRSSIQTALEVFVKGFSEVKSRLGPMKRSREERLSGKCAMPSGIGAKDYRIEEWIS